MRSHWRGWQRRVHRAVLQRLCSPNVAAQYRDSVGAVGVGGGAVAARMPLLSILYGRIIAALRDSAMAQAQRISRTTIPVISVGNFTFGATGKTPCVLFLTDVILEHTASLAAATKSMRVPMLLTRGYGDDEWRMFAARFPSCKVAVGLDRVTLGQQRVAQDGASLSCVLLEDGLQQWKIQKDLEIVMVNALAPFGNGKLLPHGSLRELPVDALSRADIVLLHHANLLHDKSQVHQLIATIQRLIPSHRKTVIGTSEMAVIALPTLVEYGSTKASWHDHTTTTNAAIGRHFQGKSAFIFCGVGNPESVELVVRAMDCWTQVEIEEFPDHYAFSEADLNDVRARVDAFAQDRRDIVLITTEKDYARSGPLLQRVFDGTMSSFRRATPRAPPAAAATASFSSTSTSDSFPGSSAAAVKRALPGTKPFLNGQALISTGLAQLDTLVGGGWLLGTLVLLDVPRHDAAAASALLVDDFHRYFVAEGVVAGQHAVVASDAADAFVAQQLPLELSMAQKQIKAHLAATNLSNAGDGEQLTIAWQYQKYMTDAASGALDKPRFCHSFDLSRPMHAELISVNAPSTLDLASYDAMNSASIGAAYEQLFHDIHDAIQTRSCTQVVRVCVRELGSLLWGPPTHAHMVALYQFVRRLRHLAATTSGRSVVFQLSGHLYAFPVAFANEVRHLSDYVLEVKSFMGESDMLPGELVEFQGLVEIKRLARTHALACHSLDAVKFGIKRERRKMKIEKFHLPPEGSRSATDRDRKTRSTSTPKAAASAGSQSNLVSSSFTRASKSSVGCGSGSSTSGGFDPLDF